MTRAALLLMLPGLLAASVASAQPASAPVNATDLERQVVRDMNAARSSNHRAPFAADVRLARAARGHSTFMASTGAFQHESANGAQFFTRLVRQGVRRNRRMAENIAMVPGCDAAAVSSAVTLWMNSPGHRANLMDPKLRRTGVGIAVMGDCEQTLITADYSG